MERGHDLGRQTMIPWLFLACIGSPLDTETIAPPDALLPADLWSGDGNDGARITLGPVVVTTPLSIERRFYVQDPTGGSGIAISLDGLLPYWPPPPGTLVTLTGTLTTGTPPVLTLDDHEDGVILGEAALPLVSWTADAAQNAALVFVDTQITSDQDPLGYADLATGGGFDGRSFAVQAPGYTSEGTLTGIRIGGRIAPRFDTDWSGPDQDVPPISVTLSEVADLPEGTPVVLEAIRATPWSRDGRWTVLQDDSGAGIWLDTAGFGVTGGAGRSHWTAEIRGDHLRTWHTPLFLEEATPAVGEALLDGALVEASLSEIGPTDLFGDRLAGDMVIDDRFVDLSTLPDPVTVIAAVRHEDEGALHLCPLSW